MLFIWCKGAKPGADVAVGCTADGWTGLVKPPPRPTVGCDDKLKPPVGCAVVCPVGRVKFKPPAGCAVLVAEKLH